MRSAAVTAGTSMTRSMRSRSGPERRAWYCAMQRSFGWRRQAKPGSVAWPQRHGFIAAMSWNRAGIGDAVVGAGDQHLAALERLAQRIEHLRLELRQLVEEQYAVVGERHLARAARSGRRRRAPPSRPNDAARGRAGGSTARRSASWPATDWIIETSSSSRGASGGRIEGSRCASIDLPAPGGPLISRLWPPAAAISRARFALSWPLMSFRSGRPLSSGRDGGLRPRHHLDALEVVRELDQRARREHLDVAARPGGLRRRRHRGR